MKDKQELYSEAEYYFIQFIFTTNRDLLKKGFRGLYDVLFDKFLPIYEDGRNKGIELEDIIKKYERSMAISFKGDKKPKSILRR